MYRPLILAAALALCTGGLASAQMQNQNPEQGASPPASSAPDAAQSAGAAQTPDPSASASTAQAFKPGMVVKDQAGATVGTISRVGHTSNGIAAAEINVEGKPVTMALASLTLSPDGDHAISSLTKAQVEANIARTPG